MRVSWILFLMWLASVSRCGEPAPSTPADPRPGDFVRIRGTLGEEVDCRTLRTEEGNTFALSARLSRYPNGGKVCVHGTLIEGHCMTTPMIDVQFLKPLSSCP